MKLCMIPLPPVPSLSPVQFVAASRAATHRIVEDKPERLPDQPAAVQPPPAGAVIPFAAVQRSFAANKASRPAAGPVANRMMCLLPWTAKYDTKPCFP